MDIFSYHTYRKLSSVQIAESSAASDVPTRLNFISLLPTSVLLMEASPADEGGKEEEEDKPQEALLTATPKRVTLGESVALASAPMMYVTRDTRGSTTSKQM